MRKKVQLIDCGIISFSDAWNLQTRLLEEKNALKIQNRTRPEDEAVDIPNHILLCEHNPVYTLGKSGSEENLLMNMGELALRGIDFFKINRGGDITYHGPGQLTGYPILDLEQFFTDIHKYMRFLEEVMIKTCAEFGLDAGRVGGLTGVWVDWQTPEKARKICALGVHMSRWITMHGFGLNVSTDLTFFNHIIPCGINDKGVTSISAELGKKVEMEDAKRIVLSKFEEVFGVIVV